MYAQNLMGILAKARRRGPPCVIERYDGCDCARRQAFVYLIKLTISVRGLDTACEGNAAFERARALMLASWLAPLAMSCVGVCAILGCAVVNIAGHASEIIAGSVNPPLDDDAPSERTSLTGLPSITQTRF